MTKEINKGYCSLIVLSITGLCILLIAQFFTLFFALSYRNIYPVLETFVLISFIGLFIRCLQRWTFFYNLSTFHASFSYEALFQGFNLFNPKISTAAVEAAFLKREIVQPDKVIMPWFHVRTISSIAIPSILLITEFYLLGMNNVAHLGLILFAFLLTAFFWWTNWEVKRSFALFLSLMFGILAPLAEGFLFIKAAKIIGIQSTDAVIFLTYIVTYFSFVLTPIPFALGTLEIAYGILWLVMGPLLPGIIFPLAYRLFRAIPLIILTLFYLPRYKLNITDIYNPLLSKALSYRWSKTEENESDILLSIIIPTFNEEKRILNYLSKVIDYCKSQNYKSEIIVVDDGSYDKTVELVEETKRNNQLLTLLSFDKNRGKGAVVRDGALHAKGKYILFADADGATPINEVENMLNVAKKGADVVIAKRCKSLGAARTLVRSLFGTIFIKISNLLAIPGIADSQCGFKLFKRKTAKKLFSNGVENGWAFDIELLFLAQKLGMLIYEVPVKWNAVEGSKINPISDAIKMFFALFRIRKKWAGIVDTIYDNELIT